MNREETLLALLRDHGPALRRIARVYGGPEGEEDDLHQEILAQAWRSLPSFQGNAAAGTWLYRVALNTALTWRRRAREHAREAEPAPIAAAAMPQRADGPDVQAAILWEFLDGLGGPDRAILLLYMEGLSHRDIADATGFTAGAVGVRLHRLKRAFTERYLEDRAP